jgi:hypothetical protein
MLAERVLRWRTKTKRVDGLVMKQEAVDTLPIYLSKTQNYQPES